MILTKNKIKDCQIQGLNARRSDLNRLELSQFASNWNIDFASLIVDRLDLYKKTTFVPNKKIPIHNWFPYLQGFSADLVDLLLDHFQATPENVVLDPWCGVGTTNIVCSSRAINSVGVDISPLAVFISKTKLSGLPDRKSLNPILQKLKLDFSNATFDTKQPEFDVIQKAIPQETYSKLVFLKEKINSLNNTHNSNFLRLALLVSLGDLSLLQKDGAHYRFRQIPNSFDVWGTFIQTVNSMLLSNDCLNFEDLVKMAKTTDIHIGDSRNLHFLDNSSINFVITSPPYLNRNNYIAQNKLELIFGDFVNDFQAYRDLTFSTLRSHVEAKWSGGNSHPEIPQLNIYLDTLNNRKEHINNSKTIEMIEGYFEDMFNSLKEIARVLTKGGKAAIVVGNSCWAGVSIEVDKILTTMARELNLKPLEIWVTRYKLNSAQQITTFGKIPIRESIILLEKE